MADEKEVWKLNCAESIAYRGIRDVFVGAFMLRDFLDFKKEDE